MRTSSVLPFGFVGLVSIPAVVFVGLGAMQIFMLPQGSGPPLDETFWHPLIPYAILAGVAFAAGCLFWAFKRIRDVLWSTAIFFGAGTLGFGMLMFATAERASIDDFVAATPPPPENSYTCTRNADGGMECLNALGEPDPNYSYTVIQPKKTEP